MRTITASIDPAVISKVSRFFDASDHQIINEMLQNARRAPPASTSGSPAAK